MATEIKSLITVCLPFQKVKLNGVWYLYSDAVAKEVEEARKHPGIWIFVKNHSCRDCTLIKECLAAQ